MALGITLAKIDKANKTTSTDTLYVQIIKTTLLDTLISIIILQIYNDLRKTEEAATEHILEIAHLFNESTKQEEKFEFFAAPALPHGSEKLICVSSGVICNHICIFHLFVF